MLFFRINVILALSDQDNVPEAAAVIIFREDELIVIIKISDEIYILSPVAVVIPAGIVNDIADMRPDDILVKVLRRTFLNAKSLMDKLPQLIFRRITLFKIEGAQAVHPAIINPGFGAKFVILLRREEDLVIFRNKIICLPLTVCRTQGIAL